MAILYAPIKIMIGPKGSWLEYTSLISNKRVDPFVSLLFEDKKKVFGAKKVANILRRLRSNPTTVLHIIECETHRLFKEQPEIISTNLHNMDGITHMMHALSGSGFMHNVKCFFRKNLKVNEELRPLLSQFFMPHEVNGHDMADAIQMVGRQLPPSLRNWLGLYTLENIAIELQNIKINPKGRIPSLYSQVFPGEYNPNSSGFKENTNATNHGGSGGGGSPKNGRVAEINRQVRELKRVGKMSR